MRFVTPVVFYEINNVECVYWNTEILIKQLYSTNKYSCVRRVHTFYLSYVSNFQWAWRYRCLNVTHKKPYKSYEGKTNNLLIEFIGYVNDLNELQQFTVSSKIPPSTSMHFSTLLATVRVALLRSSWRSCFVTAALFIM